MYIMRGKVDEMLIVNLDEYSECKIECINDIGHSVFKSNYLKSIEAVNDILNYSNGNTRKSNLKYFKERNNVICFSGERGSGKTSCMESFANIIENLSGSNRDIKVDLRSVLSDKYLQMIERISEHSYARLKTIEPKVFKDNGNLLEILLTSIYDDYEENIKLSSKSEFKPIHWYEVFNKVYDGLNTIVNKVSHLREFSAPERLSMLRNSSNLECNLYELIEMYLGAKLNAKQKYLIITIDDLDLEPEHAKEMIDQIRKYLMLPNLIVLVSLNMEELAEILSKDEPFVMGMSKTNNSHSEQYLAKLFPEGRRVYMPSSYDVFGINLKIERNNQDYIFDSIESGIREIIFSRTGLLFSEVSGGRNSIVPHSLRNMVNMIAWLFNMTEYYLTTSKIIDILSEKLALKNIDLNLKLVSPDLLVELAEYFKDIKMTDLENQFESNFSITIESMQERTKNENDKKLLMKFKEHVLKVDSGSLSNVQSSIKGYEESKHKSKENRTRFMEYFRNNWMRSNLSKEHFDFIDGINKVPVITINKYIINNLNIIFCFKEEFIKSEITEEDGISKYIQERKDITIGDNNSGNISFGDVLFMLHSAEKLVKNKEESNLIFAIRFIYSYWLYEYHNEVKLNNFDLKENNYAKMIGQNVYNIRDYELIKYRSEITEFSFYNFYNQILSDVFSMVKGNSPTNEWYDKFIYKSYELEYNSDQDINKLIKLLNAFESVLHCITVYRKYKGIKRYRNSVYWDISNVQIYPSNRDIVLFDIFGIFVSSSNFANRLQNMYVRSELDNSSKEYNLRRMFELFEEAFKNVNVEYSPIYKKLNNSENYYVGTIEALENILEFRASVYNSEDVVGSYIQYAKELVDHVKPINEKFKRINLKNSFFESYLIKALEFLNERKFKIDLSIFDGKDSIRRYSKLLDSSIRESSYYKSIFASPFLAYNYVSEIEKLGLIETLNDNVEDKIYELLLFITKNPKKDKTYYYDQLSTFSLYNIYSVLSKFFLKSTNQSLDDNSINNLNSAIARYMNKMSNNITEEMIARDFKRYLESLRIELSYLSFENLFHRIIMGMGSKEDE